MKKPGTVFVMYDTPQVWLPVTGFAMGHNLSAESGNFAAASTVPKEYEKSHDVTSVYRVFIGNDNMAEQFERQFSEHILGTYEPGE